MGFTEWKKFYLLFNNKKSCFYKLWDKAVLKKNSFSNDVAKDLPSAFSVNEDKKYTVILYINLALVFNLT